MGDEVRAERTAITPLKLFSKERCCWKKGQVNKNVKNLWMRRIKEGN